MYKPDFATIARHIVHDNARVRPGERVLIRARADAQYYAELIGTECARAGAHPLIVAANDEFRLRVGNETISYATRTSSLKSTPIGATPYSAASSSRSERRWSKSGP
jgi:hypothetical protein